MKTGTREKVIRIVLATFSLAAIAALIAGYLFWRAVYKNNVNLPEGTVDYLYLKTGSDYDGLIRTLDENSFLKNPETFKWLAARKNLPSHIYPGRYEIVAGMNNDELIDMLRSGAQKPLNVIFNNLRTVNQLAGVIGRQIEADSTSIINIIESEDFENQYGFGPKMATAMFIPNTYEFYWNTNATQFAKRMHKEYLRFWNEARVEKAKLQKLTPAEVSVVASIVDKETIRNDEKARIAGVYLNRLRKGWKLQADPTTVYAFFLENDSILRRVYRKHTQMDSPYNTYVVKGLPPGPICLPSISSIEAVLNAEDHDYMYFVAKADGSGYHHFSKTYRQHLRYAEEHYENLKNSN